MYINHLLWRFLIIKIKLPDGSLTEVEASSASAFLLKAKAVAYRKDTRLWDISECSHLSDGDTIELIDTSTPEGIEILRHSTSHIMAHAVKALFPETKVTIGPATSDGFYYDFDRDTPFSPEDLSLIENKMKEIIKQNNPFVRKVISKAEAIKLFNDLNEPYKVEIINEIPDETVSLYEEGGFVDLCLGPHIPKTGFVKAFKLLSIAGAYWRGDEKNKMLQRIYGTAFDTKEALDKHLEYLQEVKRRDHRRLGKELDLFSISDDIGPGLILWHPKGAIIRKTIEDFWRAEHEKADYQLLYTPHIARLNLWQMSGHWDFYRENMYSPMQIDDIAYELKPMNCPFHIGIFKSSLKSYRDLPLRFAELGTVYRYERSGVLHGLLRVRGFTQDDAHIFCTEEQLTEEIANILNFTLYILKTFGFDKYDIYLSTRPQKSVGSDANWQNATDALRLALEGKGLAYEIDPGEGVFYGPKIDIKIKDALNRSWQCSTIQVDFNLPERFDITYRGADGKEHRPIMIHRALMGSLERFFGILVEHYAGVFPLWLSPVQVAVLTISDKHIDYAKSVYQSLKKAGLRAILNTESEKIGAKIRTATLAKIPYLLILGDSEVSSNTVTVRLRNGTNLGSISLQELISRLQDEITQKISTKEVAK